MTTQPDPHNVMTPERFASGMTFAEYIRFAATPANLKREASGHTERIDRSGQMRSWYEGTLLADYQVGRCATSSRCPAGR